MKKTVEEIFNLYDEGVNHLRQIGIYEQTKKNYNFFEGRQWEGLEANGYNPPTANVIKQIVKHKYNTISMQDVEIIFTSNNIQAEPVTKILNSFMEQYWEDHKMYIHTWKVNKASHIAGDSSLYFYRDGCQLIDNTNILFADERETDVQKQKYIIISQRLNVSDVKEIARKEGVSEDLVEQIVSDEEMENKHQPNFEKRKNDKVTVLIFLEKIDGEVHFYKCVRNVIYQKGNTKLKLYPIARLICNERKGYARGMGEVEPLIDNQIEINKTLWRRGMSIQQTAFPKMVVNEDRINNSEDLKKAGAVLRTKGPVTDVNELIKYLAPSYIGNDAKQYSDELIMLTKELNNSGDGATGQIDPTKASGAAVQAVTQQANVSSSEQMANYKQFIEDIGYILLDMWKTYNPDGLKVQNGEKTVTVPVEELSNVKLKINVTQATPFNKWAVESELKSLYQAGAITLEEFVNSLDENSMMPKNKLLKILEQRGIAQQKEQIANKLLEIIANYQMNDVVNSAGIDNTMPLPNINEGEIQNV